MNQHQQIMVEMQRQYDELGNAIIVSPDALAYKVYLHFQKKKAVDPHIQYTSLEHMKSMARKFLAKNHDPALKADEPDDDDQAQMFSGELQDRYPVPTKKGEERQYKKRSALTHDERSWNVKRLRKAGKSLLEHADALEAEGRGRLSA